MLIFASECIGLPSPTTDELGPNTSAKIKTHIVQNLTKPREIQQIPTLMGSGSVQVERRTTRSSVRAKAIKTIQYEYIIKY